MAEIPNSPDFRSFQEPQKPKIEVIRAGFNSFQMFPRDKTRKFFHPELKKTIYDRKIMLDTDGLLPELPIMLAAYAAGALSINTLSPYTSDGYQFTGRETDPEQRARILDTLVGNKMINYDAAPLYLQAHIYMDVLRDMGLIEGTKPLDSLVPEVKKKFTLLRLQVALPSLETLDLEQPLYTKFVSRPTPTALEVGELRFNTFTPQETPRLPIPQGYKGKAYDGYFLHIPSDDKIIEKIQAQIILMPEGTPENI